ncbi:hypothetical protein [Aquimarina sp. AU474]|uniref:hypothetical protein n=1 Tax=Aquimarina sp. AU474 TaxID=2108529 RepID=UPI001356AFEF|nr:hypothetical protein [Aquimarina sp. AU474]
MLKLVSFILMLSIFNCAPAKKGISTPSAGAAQNETAAINAKEMIDKGFSKGTITNSKSQGCPYILNVEQYKDNLDPVNLGEFFKGDIPDHVWVKFASLRMPSRCDTARPVNIIEINKRSTE